MPRTTSGSKPLTTGQLVVPRCRLIPIRDTLVSEHGKWRAIRIQDKVQNGTVFRTVGGDGVERLLVQMPGEVNGVAGRFEWIVDGGSLTHQMFVRGGTLNGIPIKR